MGQFDFFRLDLTAKLAILKPWQRSVPVIRSNCSASFPRFHRRESKDAATREKGPCRGILGRKGGLARAAALPAKKRTQIAAKGAKAGWKGKT